MIKRALVGAMAAVLSVGCASKVPEAQKMSIAPDERKPAAVAKRLNVIVILADDLGYADIGAQGISKDVRTPNIDSIARSGVRFTNGYVSCPVCSPTRAGFLTGRYQQRFGHEFNPGGNRPEDFGLPLDQVLFPQVMKQAGYATGMVGKWHQGTMEGYAPTERGFDEFYGFLGGGHPYVDLKPSGKNSIFRNTTPIDEKEYLTDAFSREAAAYIDRNHDKPFFLYVAYNAVHTPQQAPEKYLQRFSGENDKHRQLMLAMQSAMDDGVGQMLEKLRKYNIEENTLVFFFTDNGGPTPSNGSRNTPLSGYKGQVWEGGIRIPFMAQWKGTLPAGMVLDQPVIALDILPTAAAAVGAKVPSDRPMDGVDLLPLMKGETKNRPHEQLYWRFGSQWAIRSGDYKLVHFDKNEDKLFDLSKDIGEKKDLSSERPEVKKSLTDQWKAWNAQLMEPRWKNKAKFEEQLETMAKQEAKGKGGADGDKAEKKAEKKAAKKAAKQAN